MAIKKADSKIRLMTGTYVLQSNRSKFNQYNVNPTCILCKEEPEDQKHFLLRCPRLTDTRDSFFRTINVILTEYLVGVCVWGGGGGVGGG